MYEGNHNQYYVVALNAIKQIEKRKTLHPRVAWNDSLNELKVSEKGCPLSSFLGLCEEGLVKFVPIKKYTRARENKEHAIRAVQFLKNCKSKMFKNGQELWIELKIKTSYQGQMDVVLALWENNYIL